MSLLIGSNYCVNVITVIIIINIIAVTCCIIIIILAGQPNVLILIDDAELKADSAALARL